MLTIRKKYGYWTDDFLILGRSFTMSMIEFFKNSHLINNMINLDDLPFHVFQKDFDGKYINCNDRIAIDAGFNSKNDLIGLSDLDIKAVIRNCLQNFQKNDRNVIA